MRKTSNLPNTFVFGCSLVVKGRKVLCINSCYLLKDWNKKNHSIERSLNATLSFTFNEKFRPQTKDSFHPHV